MKFKENYFKAVLPKIKLPVDVLLALPKNSFLPLAQQHFLLYIPWESKYFALIPKEFQDFFIKIHSYLQVRTTDVHTAISFSYLDLLLKRINQPINKRVVVLALLLHDSGWSRLTELEIENSFGFKGLKLNDIALAPKEQHAFESEKIARQVLATYPFAQPIQSTEIELICKAILYHDQPEAVVNLGQDMSVEVQALVDIDHLWSYTHQNFWLDVVRKGIDPLQYLQNLADDLTTYFVTTAGKEMAKEQLVQRVQEVKLWQQA